MALNDAQRIDTRRIFLDIEAVLSIQYDSFMKHNTQRIDEHDSAVMGSFRAMLSRSFAGLG